MNKVTGCKQEKLQVDDGEWATERGAGAPARRVSALLVFIFGALLVLLSLLLAFFAVAAFSTLRPARATSNDMALGAALCAHPAVRQEWRALTNSQKASYISAVQCLQRLPGTTNLPGARTRFDDFQAIHVLMSEEIHLVGQFLPWHRRLLNVFETALREECAFHGVIPYWDWSQDVDSGLPLARSPVFDAVHGFGGNGADVPDYAGQFGNLTLLSSAGWVAPGAGGGCVLDGPFAAYNLSVGPGTTPTNHCLQRALNDNISGFLSGARVASVLRQPTFEAFRVELEGAPVTTGMRLHDGGHNAIGGEMGDRFSSPGDPIFYLHHAFLDKLWWQWAGLKFPSRLDEVSGRSTPSPPFASVSLDFELDMKNLGPVVKIREMMDIRNNALCYTYQ